MPSRLLLAGMLGLFFAASPVSSEPAKVVVELFTSQGCSSCPPADDLFEQLAARPDVIALALHVDYWDYLGWADSFARPEFTARQHGYAAAAGSHTVYTPQFVIGGEGHVVGAKAMQIMDRIQSAAAAQTGPQLTVTRRGQRVVIAAPATAGIPNAQVHLVTYIPRRTVEIGQGENAGRRIVYVNVVDQWQNLGAWDGASDLSMAAPLADGVSAVVLLQVTGFGPILAATQVASGH